MEALTSVNIVSFILIVKQHRLTQIFIVVYFDSWAEHGHNYPFNRIGTTLVVNVINASYQKSLGTVESDAYFCLNTHFIFETKETASA